MSPFDLIVAAMTAFCPPGGCDGLPPPQWRPGPYYNQRYYAPLPRPRSPPQVHQTPDIEAMGQAEQREWLQRQGRRFCEKFPTDEVCRRSQ